MRSIRSALTRSITLPLVIAVLVAACSATSTPDGDTGREPGIKTGIGVTDDTITIGMLTDLSGPAGSLGKVITDAQETFWEYLNEEEDGIAGRKVELVIEDTQFDPQIAQEKYESVKGDVLAISQLFGTPSSEELRATLETDNMLASPASLSAGLARAPNFVMIGTPYRMSVANSVEHIVGKQDGKEKKIAIVYENDAYGQDAVAGWNDAKATYAFDDVGQLPYDTASTDLSAIVDQLVGSSAQYVVLAALPVPGATIIGGAADRGFTTEYYALSPAYDFHLLSSPIAQVLATSAFVTTSLAYWGENVRGMLTMLAAVDRYSPEYNDNPDSAFIFGWTQAAVVAKILDKAADDGDLTREGVLEAFRTIGEVDTRGLLPPLNYGDSPQERVPTREDRILKVVVDNPDFPGGLEPITVFFESEAARNAAI